MKKEIMFLEQLSYRNNNTIREWQSVNIEKSVIRNREEHWAGTGKLEKW